MTQRIVMAGGTGFIGRALCTVLAETHDLVVLSRAPDQNQSTPNARVTSLSWSPPQPGPWVDAVNGAHAVINLAGENVASAYWTAARKRKIIQSRLDAASALVAATQLAHAKPDIFIQASAVGYYGNRGEQILQETSPPGDGFLADTCLQWEQTLQPLANSATRTVSLRLAPVLGLNGGFLAKVLPSFKFSHGRYLACAEQWFPWIHLDDVVSAVQFILRHLQLSGPVNLTSPQPITARQFYQALAQALGYRRAKPLPTFAAKLAMGDMARELILASQRVLPKKLLHAAYSFRYPDITSAIEIIVPRASRPIA